MEIFICVLSVLLLLSGVVAVFLPLVPTPLLSCLGVLVCFFGWPTGPVNGGLLCGAVVLTILVHVFEFLGGYLGAKWFGATWRGGLGALVGGVVLSILLFFLLPGVGFALGLFLGPFLGAIVGELLGRREWREATRSGVGTLLGNLAAMLAKLAVTLLMLAVFSGAVLYRLVAQS
ncbi:MAG: DUF456 domain-containing protein [Puniceicoccales bacterium]|jgi:uncharacterized protein YqgC (DUF456 family)|nr:DUF456 domain-containing protein [Puniceicoccales bacterium]